MAAPTPKDASKGKQRGTQDELEILAQIVTQTPTVRTQVLLKLKDAKDRVLKARETKLRNAGVE